MIVQTITAMGKVVIEPLDCEAEMNHQTIRVFSEGKEVMVLIISGARLEREVL